MRTDEPQAIHLKDYHAPDYKVFEIALDFVLDPAATRVGARLRMARTGAEDAPLVLNGEALKLVSVALDGKLLAKDEYSVDAEHLTIPNLPEKFVLDIVTEIAPEQNTLLSGLYTSKGMFCTQCEAEGFRRITYFLDRPDVLAVYTTRIEADRKLYPVLLSNGNLITKGDLPGGRHFAVWRDPFPKPCYLFALVAGDLGRIEDEFVTMSGRKVDLKIFVEHGNENKALYAMDSLKRAMKWDEEAYGREYDLDIFMIVAVSAFNFGAMENKGLNIFNDKVLLASPETATDDDYGRIEGVVAHEYFHNWSGDRITCRDWFQLSLKEGFTVFRDQGFSADMRSHAVKRIEEVRALRLRQFQEDAGPLAHPVQPQSYISIDNFYTATIYEKGAELIGMLKTLVGDETYRKATDLYFARHDGQAATVEDWVRCFEEASGRDLSQFRLWYAQAGTPVVGAKGLYDKSTKTYTLSLAQTLRPTPGQPEKKPMHIPVRLGFIGKSGASLPLTLEGENATGPEERVLELTEASQNFVFVGVEEEPILSLGRGFSAPAVFAVDHSPADRTTLMAHDPDSFNRWEAGQTAARAAMMAMMQGASPDPLYVAALGPVLDKAMEDMAFAANMLSLPLESEIAMAMPVVDPDAIHAARMGLVKTVAAAHRAKFAELYAALGEDGPFSPEAKAAGKRALRNACLRYLTAEDDEAAATLAHRHYLSATNMTDMIAGLAALTRMSSAKKDEAFTHFHDRFAKDALVLDKWMGLQAGSPRADTVVRVRALMEHAAFDIKNPNRVRALVGAFSANQLRFHAADGSGYALVGDVVRKLDGINAQVAARMAGAFETWRRFDPARQALIRAELEKTLAISGISSNLFEVMSKTLA
ncbi:aminopeptidase N [Rhizomicrobium palustre]|uniref:Aminopeptidase N n=1 Tax=Rhizomicrobium palustre TaxID=189966 RepID=A0A846N125_9PROT|nr:aminopeptidase N [Rhizomicrobium palustre]NIK88860.1 aminopeptidase N [Rhizomicrobium palustre]